MLRGDVPILAALLGVGVVVSPLVVVRADDVATVAPGGPTRSDQAVTTRVAASTVVDEVATTPRAGASEAVARPLEPAPIARTPPQVFEASSGSLAGAMTIVDRGFALVTDDAGGLTRVDGAFARDERAVLVHVAASWCEPCAEDLPGFLALAAGAPRTVFIAAEDVAGPSGLANAFEALMARAEPSSRAVPSGIELRADPAWAWAQWLGHETLPLTAVIDREGRLVFVAEGVLDDAARARAQRWLEEGS